LDFKTVIEYGVNYGRGNDTVASFVATLIGAYRGMDDLPVEWIDIVNSENSGVSIEEVSKKLAGLIKPN
jgi:ADP-ribosylglycohydrolase